MRVNNNNSRLLNWPAYPLLRLLLMIIVGIYLSTIFSVGIFKVLFALLAGLILVITLNSKKSIEQTQLNTMSIVILILFLLFGFLRGTIQKSDNNPQHYKHVLNEKHRVEGQIIQTIKHATAISTVIDVHWIDHKICNGKLLIYFNKKENSLPYHLGDVISFNSYINKIENNSNPHSFDYQRLMKYKEIEYQTFVPLNEHNLVRKDKVFLPYHYANQAREYAIGVLRKRIKGEDQFATTSAMVLGKKEYIREELNTAFSETGAIHVLAVSGLHVGIILLLFRLFFDQFSSSSQRMKIFRFIILVTIVLSYALITGASAAVLRAATMFIAMEYGRLWHPNTNIYNILALSAIILLTYNPYFLFQLGFIFSYCALISILFFQPRIMNLIDRYIYYESEWARKFWQLVSVSIAAQVMIFPVSVYYFHKFPLSFIISGVAAVGLAPFVLGIGLLIISFDWLGNFINWLAYGYNKLLTLFVDTIYFINDLPLKPLKNIYISSSSVVLLYVLVFVVMYILSYKERSNRPFYKQNYRTRKKAAFIGYLAICGLIIFNISFTFKSKTHQELIVYDFYKNTMIDIFIGNQVYSITNENIDEKKKKYVNENYRIYRNYPTERKISINDSLQTDYISIDRHGLSFQDKHLAFAEKINLDSVFVATSDVLLVTHNTDKMPYKLLKNHTTKEVVLDASLTYEIRNRWAVYCRKNDINYYDISKEGPYIIE